MLLPPITSPLLGEITIPSDKSISHRAAMFLALTNGTSRIKNFSKGKDCLSTLSVIKELGVVVQWDGNDVIISSSGVLKPPTKPLNCGNSGTTMRLMSGILSAQNFESTLIGDNSLHSRPMKRIIEPLSQMGANIQSNNGKAPLTIKGQKLKAINYNSPIASAQVKSAILLAGLFAEGKTVISEPYKSRDHTERMLEYLGADMQPKPIEIPGDISSAAFFMVAGAIVKGSDILLKNVGVNPTRTGVIDVMQKMNADISFENQREVNNEPIADIRIKYSNPKATTIEGEIIPRLIDEIPVLAVLATQAEGGTIIKGAGDLKNKESDRLKSTFDMLKKMGADIKMTEDGFIINGKTKLKGNCTIESCHDHRIAMSAYVAGLVADDIIKIKGFDCLDISFPEFEELFKKVRSGGI